MGKFEGKLIVTDFDDTFRPYGQWEVPQANLEAVEYFIQEGGKFTVATGRSPLSFLSIHKLFHINVPAILCNGAVLFDDETGEDVFENFLPFTIRDDLTEVLKAFPDFGMEIHRGTDVRVCRRNSGVDAHLEEMRAPLQEADASHVMYPWTFVCLCGPAPLDQESERAQELVQAIHAKRPGAYEAVTAGSIIDITTTGINKGNGVARLAQYLGIEPENIICVGDNRNDIPMLQMAGQAFCPSTALEEVKAIEGIRVLGKCPTLMQEIIQELA